MDKDSRSSWAKGMAESAACLGPPTPPPPPLLEGISSEPKERAPSLDSRTAELNEKAWSEGFVSGLVFRVERRSSGLNLNDWLNLKILPGMMSFKAPCPAVAALSAKGMSGGGGGAGGSSIELS